MPSARPAPPIQTSLHRPEVVASERLSPNFQRVTLGGLDLDTFAPLGFDQWFRFFLPAAGEPLRLPTAHPKLWYPQYLAIPAKYRPHLSNYTVREFRPQSGELDVDVVIHTNPKTGVVDAGVAAWALRAEVGDTVGLLDQGVLFNPPADTSSVILAADESGLPGVEGILRSLPADARGLAVVEVPTEADRRELPGPNGVQVVWVVREGLGGVDARPGHAALETLRSLANPDAHSYGFVVGESRLATGGRRALVERGLGKDRITFSGFWKHGH